MILEKKLNPNTRKNTVNMAIMKSSKPKKEGCTGVEIEKIPKTIILIKKSIRDIVTALITTTSLGKLILRITPALLRRDVRPFKTPSLNMFIIIIPINKPIL